MDMKVPEGLLRLKVQLSPAMSQLNKVANTPRITFAIKAAALFVVLFITYTLFAESSGLKDADYRGAITAAVKGKKNIFIQNALMTEVDGPFDNRTIVDLCAKTQWTPGLIFSCEAPEGGVGNVRNVFLNCVRYAIEAGATGFVVPEMMALTSGTKSSPVPFGHFFDTAHFTSSLSAACPQMRVFGHINDLYDMPSTSPAIKINPLAFNHTVLIDKHILGNPGNWSLSFHQHLNYTHPVPPTAAKPLLVTLPKPLLEFPLTYDDPHFVPAFGRLLRFREDVRRLAAAVLFALSKKHDLDLTFNADNTIASSAFYGAHLRTGVDAQAAGWTTYEVQSQNYLGEAIKNDLDVMYVASSNAADLARLAAANMSIAIETKESLLGTVVEADKSMAPAKGFEREWAELITLGWDQQLLVDYEVLLRSTIFGGTWESSFSWNVAMRRHVIVGGGAWRVISKREEGVQQGMMEKRRNKFTLGDSDANNEKKETGEGDEVVAATATTFTTSAEEKQEWRYDGQNKHNVLKRAPTPPVAAAKPEKSQADAHEISAEGIREKLGVTGGSGERTFTDGLSVVFGPPGVGKRIVGSMWP